MNRLRPETLLLPVRTGSHRVREPQQAVVVGGGLAGVAAATVLAERGVSVTLVEKHPFLGGRVAAWTERLDGGGAFEMERGFHAFFRHYYSVRALLRRADPSLDLLAPLDDYPILAPGGAFQSFRNLPHTSPLNVIELTRRSPELRLRDLVRVNGRAALGMLSFDPERTYREHDHRSAKEYLDSLRFPPAARRMLFDVFSHSFFNPESEMSAAELLMMFHFYFMGNPEGLVFDVLRRPFSHSLWEPMRRHLERLGVEFRLGTAAVEVGRDEEGKRWRVRTEGEGASLAADLVVLAPSVPALKGIVHGSPALDDPGFRRSIDGLEVTSPFAVLRLWLDRPTRAGRPAFAGTTACGELDNISLYHLFEDESRDWARRTGGSVVELHAYAVPKDCDAGEIRGDLVRGLHELYPETAEAKVVHELFLLRRDCPAFAPGSHAQRPGVETPFVGLVLAGDFVRLPFPSALMERAVASGMLAANHLLAPLGVRPEAIRTVPRRGLLAPWLS